MRVRFDDRLSTVLGHPAHTDHDRAVRWRQLVDLIARAGTLESSRQADAALDLIRSDAPHLPKQLRAAAARAVAAMPIPFELVSLFAEDDLQVSAPVLAAASLEPEEWERVFKVANAETARFVRTLHPHLEAMAPASARSQQVSAGTGERIDPRPAPTPSIEDVIQRIEALRASRPSGRQAGEVQPAEGQPPTGQEPSALPAGADSNLFRWECGPSGELEWVEGAPRAALIGRPLVEAGHDRKSGSGEIARAFAVRAPFSNASVSIGAETALAGEWQMSGVPAFDHSTGRFAGYRGVAKRTRSTPQSAETSIPPNPDTLRELVHEIKTPLNAIMGFAEIIQTQMFGPAGQSYRARASEIVAQSHLLLAAIDDLDLAAKLQAGAFNSDLETDLAQVLEQVAPELEQKARGAEVELRLLVDPHLPPCAVSPAIVERLLQRLIGVLIDCSEPSERLRVTASEWEEKCAISVDRPSALRNVGEKDLLDPSFSVPRQRNARLSLGFSLRLVRGIVQLAGGDMIVSRSKLTLVMVRGDLRPPASRRYRLSAGRGL